MGENCMVYLTDILLREKVKWDELEKLSVFEKQSNKLRIHKENTFTYIIVGKKHMINSPIHVLSRYIDTKDGGIVK